MATYDGEVRIGTKVDTSQMQQLNIQIEKAARKVEELKDKYEELKDKKIPTDDFKEVQEQIDKARAKMDVLIDKKDKFRGSKRSTSYANMTTEIEELRDTIKYAEGEVKELVDTGKDFTLGKDTEEFRKTARDLEVANAELRKFVTKREELTTKQEDIAIKKQNDIVSGLKKIRSASSKAFTGVRKDVGKTSNTFGRFGRRLKSLAMSLLVFNWISKGFRAMVNGMKEGYKNLVQYSEDYNRSASMLMSANTQLKNSLATAFGPLIQMTIPHLLNFVGLLTEGANRVAQFVAAMTGAKSWTKAVAVQQDYAESLGNTKKAAEKAIKALAGFDELNVMQKQIPQTSSGLSASDMFTEIEIDNKTLQSVKKMKDMLSNLKKTIEPLLKSLDNLWNNGLSKLKDFTFTGLKDFYSEFLVPMGNWAFGTEGKGITRIVDIINNGLMKIPWEVIKKNLKEFWIAIEPYAESFGEGLIDFFEDMSNVAIDIFIMLFGEGGALVKFTNWLNRNDPERARDWGYALGQIATALLLFKGLSFLTPVVKLVAKVFKFFGTSQVGGKIASFLTPLALGFKNLSSINFSSILGGITNFFNSLSPGIIGLMGMEIDRLIEGTFLDTREWEGVFKILNDTLWDLTYAGGEVITDIFDYIIKIIDNVFNFNETKFWIGKSNNWFNKISEDFKNNDWGGIGKDILFGILNGLGGALTGLVEPFKDLFSWIFNGICNEFDMHSPSKKMMPLGEYILLGIVQGFTGKISAFSEAIKKWFDEAVKPWFTTEKWEGLLTNIPNAFKNKFEETVKLVKNLLGGLFDWIGTGLNKFFGENSLFKNISSFGSFDISQTAQRTTTDIPRLANGAVIRGGNPFMAILGDQPTGHTNIEAPLSTIETALQNVLNKNGSSGDVNLNVYLDGDTVYKTVVKRDRIHRDSTGHSSFAY